MRNSQPSLSHKQLRWIDEYLIDFNGAAAAVRAGYSPKSARSIAHENTTKPDIQAVLQARQAAMAKELQITRQGVVQQFLEAVNMGREQQNPGAMVGALREIAKMLGFYQAEVKNFTIDLAGRPELQAFHRMSDAELMAIVEAGASRVP